MPPTTIGTNRLMAFKQAPNGKRCPKDEPGRNQKEWKDAKKTKPLLYSFWFLIGTFPVPALGAIVYFFEIHINPLLVSLIKTYYVL